MKLSEYIDEYIMRKKDIVVNLKVVLEDIDDELKKEEEGDYSCYIHDLVFLEDVSNCKNCRCYHNDFSCMGYGYGKGIM